MKKLVSILCLMTIATACIPQQAQRPPTAQAGNSVLVGATPTQPTETPPGIVALPPPQFDRALGISLEQALLERRSVRDYQPGALTLTEVAQLLWAAQGVSDPQSGFRTAPSAGATFPLELYLVAGEVGDLPAGIYRYRPHSHELERLAEGDRRAELYDAALRQSPVRVAPVNLVFSAVYARTTARYGERGIRYVHMEVGHAAQNVYLQAVSLGLGTVVIGAFDDEGVRRALNLPAAEEPLYILPVGRK